MLTKVWFVDVPVGKRLLPHLHGDEFDIVQVFNDLVDG